MNNDKLIYEMTSSRLLAKYEVWEFSRSFFLLLFSSSFIPNNFTVYYNTFNLQMLHIHFFTYNEKKKKKLYLCCWGLTFINMISVIIIPLKYRLYDEDHTRTHNNEIPLSCIWGWVYYYHQHHHTHKKMI